MKVIIKNINNKGEEYVLRSFSSKKAAKAWIMRGMCSCEGAEQEHYVLMLGQLESGETTLYYNNPYNIIAHFTTGAEFAKYLESKGY